MAAGRAHLGAWRIEEAIAAFDAALWLRPDDPVAHYVRGEALFLLRRLDAALASHAAALRYGIDRDGIGRGRAMSGLVPGDYAWMSYMLRGDFAAAWHTADAEGEARRRAGITGVDWPRQMRPVWDGVPLDGGRVLVRCYHGLGDTLQFIRYVPRLARHAASVSVETQPELIPLLERMSGIDRLFALPEARDHACGEFGCNREIDVTELPHACRSTLDTIPTEIPYLRAAPAQAAAAARRLAQLRPGRRVGLVWAAGGWKPERSLPVGCLAPLGAAAGLRLIALQRGPEYERWRAAADGPPMENGFGSDDIAETAATIAGLDLVITVDTMVAHLAGALGVPVWVMLHFAADWRWLLDRSDSPWYPTMRLFRQKRAEDWGPVVAEIAGRLAAMRRREAY